MFLSEFEKLVLLLTCLIFFLRSTPFSFHVGGQVKCFMVVHVSVFSCTNANLNLRVGRNSDDDGNTGGLLSLAIMTKI